MDTEERHLAEADRHIAEAELRIAEQEKRLAAMEVAGHKTDEGHRLLAAFRATLEELVIHRGLILDNLARR